MGPTGYWDAAVPFVACSGLLGLLVGHEATGGTGWGGLIGGAVGLVLAVWAVLTTGDGAEGQPSDANAEVRP